MNGSTAAGQYLLCRLHDRTLAVPIAHAIEVMRPLPISPMRGAPAFVVGVAIVRGAPSPVVDAVKLLLPSGVHSSELSEPNPDARFVAIRCRAHTVLLWVDAVAEIRTLTEDLWRALPPLLQDANADAVAAMGTLDQALLLIFEATRVVPETLWNEIASPRSTS